MTKSKSCHPSVPFSMDVSLRLVTGILGSMWHGTRTCQHRIRTLFDDFAHGSNMQISAILMNLFDVATSEGYLPEEFNIGADNTYKETKNQYTLWFAVLASVRSGRHTTHHYSVLLLDGRPHARRVGPFL